MKRKSGVRNWNIEVERKWFEKCNEIVERESGTTNWRESGVRKGKEKVM